MSSDYVDMLAVLRSLLSKLDRTILFREQGVIATNANIEPRMEVGTTLTHDDIAGNHFLPTVHFHAKSFTF